MTSKRDNILAQCKKVKFHLFSVFGPVFQPWHTKLQTVKNTFTTFQNTQRSLGTSWNAIFSRFVTFLTFFASWKNVKKHVFHFLSFLQKLKKLFKHENSLFTFCATSMYSSEGPKKPSKNTTFSHFCKKWHFWFTWKSPDMPHVSNWRLKKWYYMTKNAIFSQFLHFLTFLKNVKKTCSKSGIKKMAIFGLYSIYKPLF